MAGADRLGVEVQELRRRNRGRGRGGRGRGGGGGRGRRVKFQVGMYGMNEGEVGMKERRDGGKRAMQISNP